MQNFLISPDQGSVTPSSVYIVKLLSHNSYGKMENICC